jgi:hypothetical protein
MDSELNRRGFCSVVLVILSFGSVASIDVAAAVESSVPGSASTASALSNVNVAVNPAPEIPTVTVTAPKPPDPEQLAGDSVPKFIAAHARPAAVTGQLARWHEGICPVSSGLSPGFNAFVSARIEAISAIVGAPHREIGHCKHNIQIIFTTEPEKLIDEVSKKRGSALLGYHYSRDTQKLATFRHPIQGWYVTATQNDNGEFAIDDAAPIQQQSAPISSVAAFALQSGTTPGGRLGTRLVTGLSSLLVHVLVIADLRKVNGYTIGSISDYLAMLVLSQTQSPDTCGPLPSILDLMASHCDAQEKPEAVTAGDLAFLHALYSTDLREKYSLEAGDIQHSMMREFKDH